MAHKPKQRDKTDMSDKEIREVFEMLKLPTTPEPLAAPVHQSTEPLVFITVSGRTPPLDHR